MFEVARILIIFVTLAGVKKGRVKSGSGRGIRGIDFGLGIGYGSEPSSNRSVNASVDIQSRSAAVKSMKSGMIAKFKSSFVAASSVAPNPNNQGTSLRGFVSGGTIGGADTRTSNIVSAPSYQGANSTARNAGVSKEDTEGSISSSAR